MKYSQISMILSIILINFKKYRLILSNIIQFLLIYRIILWQENIRLYIESIEFVDFTLLRFMHFPIQGIVVDHNIYNVDSF